MWVALKLLRMGAGELRDVGEPVPEAEHWKQRQTWIDAGYIGWAPEPTPTVPKPAAKKTPVKKKPATRKPATKKDGP